MRPSLCQSCIAFLLKFLIFLETFVGVSIIIYSVWLLSHWSRQGGLGGGFSFDLNKLPAPWFICSSMGIGVLLCLIAFMGHIAAEIVNGCCLCFYAVLTTVLILLEATLVCDLVFNKHWKEDLPYDSTGELERLHEFFEANIDICKLAAVTVVIVQALSLLLAMVLRVMVPTRRVAYDSDEDFSVNRKPLLNPQNGTTFPSASVDNRGFQSDSWSARMRQKYGLN